ncbi:7325_t:CDS:2 [Acaulospora morrowiae]|uniref:7325_t:CDS:1 n=1 Tax=Acaulospora morrowiae TaxID=94023 RepID=A0A9N9AP68_9GLOM|nr:7325_t:CDS:2 [Acaulospora morrowiae]
MVINYSYYLLEVETKGSFSEGPNERRHLSILNGELFNGCPHDHGLETGFCRELKAVWTNTQSEQISKSVNKEIDNLVPKLYKKIKEVLVPTTVRRRNYENNRDSTLLTHGRIDTVFWILPDELIFYLVQIDHPLVKNGNGYHFYCANMKGQVKKIEGQPSSQNENILKFDFSKDKEKEDALFFLFTANTSKTDNSKFFKRFLELWITEDAEKKVFIFGLSSMIQEVLKDLFSENQEITNCIVISFNSQKFKENLEDCNEFAQGAGANHGEIEWFKQFSKAYGKNNLQAMID